MTFERENTFAYRTSRGGEVFISHLGKDVTTLRKTVAVNFLRRVEKASPDQAQHLMARVTGNFKRGNERDGKAHNTL